MSKRSDRPEGLYLGADDLQVGQFVRLETGWTNHPFPFNNFRVKDERQLRQLKALGLDRFLVDPARSDAAVRSETMAAARSLMLVQAEAAAVEAAPVATPAPPTPPPLDPAVAADIAKKHERIERLVRQRELMDECERRFLGAARSVASIGKNIFAAPEATVERATNFVQGLVDSLDKYAEVHIHLMNNKLNSREVYDHGLNVTSLSLVLGQRMGFDTRELRHLGLGCVFHDLGKGELPEKVAKKVGPLSSLEREVLQMHVDHSMQICLKLGLPVDALNVIGQHHELVDGSGYPRGLGQNAISKLAKVAAVVNAFDNLCNPANASTGMTPHDALKTLFARDRGRYDADTLNAFIRVIGIYPPGTLVRLNNGSLGMVLSVNVEQSLKPTVLVYEAGVARHEAIVLALAEQPEYAIERGVQRDELSVDAAAYLNPRRRIAFFHGDS